VVQEVHERRTELIQDVPSADAAMLLAAGLLSLTR
jgi:hypothetical protein